MSSTQQLILGEGAGGAPTGYQIERSLRFNSADSAYLSRTPSSAGNRKTWTWSGWVKRSAISTNQSIFGAAGTSDSTQLDIRFSDTDLLKVDLYTVTLVATTQVFRDISAWYHIVVAFDSTQATASDRLKIYLNGTQITAFSTNNISGSLTQNGDFGVNRNAEHNIGRYPGVSTYYVNGYLTEINFIDGQALTPSSFGETDSATGVWKPKAFSGTYGTNGFYLKFADNSGTTSTTLGKDSSGNGNNWTPNNFSVTAGAGNDSLVDTPTSYGSDTGAGGEVRGNYCTLNPLNNAATSLVNGNLDSGTASGVANWLPTSGTIGVSSGKWYWEVRMNSAEYLQVGILPAAYRAVSGDYPGSASTTGYGYQSANGNKYVLGTGSSYGATFTTGDVIGVALDLDGGTLVFYKNGSSQGTAASSISGTFVPGIAVYNSTGASTVANCNFGQRPFAYTAPSGFKALCTQNLPTPTIGATSTTQADNYFNVVARTFTAATAVITGLGFSPDWLWFKRRNVAASHSLYDRLRGTNSRLLSNGTNAQITTTSAELTSFDSDGFTIGADPGSISINAANGDTGVVWCWRANGAGSSNTAGSITSTVSANADAGFSIVTYTGTGANATVGHGCKVNNVATAPSMIILKDRSSTTDWRVYHAFLNNGVTPANYTLKLNATNAEAADSTIWNNTAPTSTVFSIGANVEINANNNLYVAYCFAAVAGYSAFGGYTGNGSSTNGPFIYTGFRPALIMMKASGATGAWTIFDSKRNPSNGATFVLQPNSSAAEGTFTSSEAPDLLSNGFRLNFSYADYNSNGVAYIYAAFAEFPFKYTLAR